MKTTIKVKKTREVETSQKDTVQCAEGRLIQLDQYMSVGKDYQCRKPIIISETEEVEKGDWGLTPKGNISKCIRVEKNFIALEKGGSFNIGSCQKILALPEHFTSKQLQAIVDEKMKDGDKVLAECDYKWNECLPEEPLKQDLLIQFIKQPLILHKAKESWDDVFILFDNQYIETGISTSIDLLHYLKENYHSPKRK